ncbi:MAG: ABC transporter ATP-binding protein [Planctomycetota bacterium]
MNDQSEPSVEPLDATESVPSAASEPPPASAWRIGRHVLSYVVPHWKIFLVALLMTAVYAGASSLRAVVVGLVVEGVLDPPATEQEEGRVFRDFKKHVGPLLPSAFPDPPERYEAAQFTITEPQRIELIGAGVFEVADSALAVTLEMRRGTGSLATRAPKLHVHLANPEQLPDVVPAISGGAAQLQIDAATPVAVTSFSVDEYQLCERATQPAAWRCVSGVVQLTTAAGSRKESFEELLISNVQLDALPTLTGNSATLSLREAEGSDVMGVLWILGGFSAVLALIIAGSNFAKLYLSQSVVLRTIASIRQSLFEHLSSLSIDYYSRRQSGDLISRLTNDVGTIQYSLRFLFGNLIQQPFLLLGGLVAAFYASWQLTLCVAPFMPLLMLPVLKSGRRVHKHGRGSLSRLGELTQTMGQLLSGIRVVKAFGMEEQQRREFELRNGRFIRSSMKMMRAKITSRSFVEGLYNLMGAIIIVVGGWMLSKGLGLTLGDFAVFLSGLLMMYAPIRGMTKAYNTLQESLAGASRVFEILDAQPSVRDGKDAAALPALANSIVFEDVWFRYEDAQQWVLGGVTFEAPAGTTVALVGPTGAGKTTVLDLLARFHEPQKGRILVDGHDVATATHASLLQQVAIVGQDPFLFHTTVAENILNGRPSATQAEVEEAARAAQVHDEIMAMPDGYATVLGERGLTLSGGQRQRITIARAILKNAPILILDEATSALDTASERKVQAAIDTLMEGRTTFVIAHRLSTIQHAHQILVMQAGHVVESGTHAELLAQGGLYARLQQMQDEAPAIR